MRLYVVIALCMALGFSGCSFMAPLRVADIQDTYIGSYDFALANGFSVGELIIYSGFTYEYRYEVVDNEGRVWSYVEKGRWRLDSGLIGFVFEHGNYGLRRGSESVHGSYRLIGDVLAPVDANEGMTFKKRI